MIFFIHIMSTGAQCSKSWAPDHYTEMMLTRWGRVTHICATIIGSDNGLSPGQHQAIIWTNTGILLIGTLGTNFSKTLIEIHAFSFKKMYLKMLSGKWWLFCLSLNVLIYMSNILIITIMQIYLMWNFIMFVGKMKKISYEKNPFTKFIFDKYTKDIKYSCKIHHDILILKVQISCPGPNELTEEL